VRARECVDFCDAELRILGWREAAINAIKGGRVERRRRWSGGGGGHWNVEGGVVGREGSRDWKGVCR
jgi:hypothetical protein